MVKLNIKKNINKTLLLIGALLLLLLLLNSLYVLPNKAERYYLLGKAYETQGYYEEAKSAYENSVEIKPNSIVYNAIGNIYEFLDDHLAAINAFQKGIATDKNDIENFFDVSRIYIHLEEYGKAEESLLLIANKETETSSIYALLGTVYIETKKWDKAENYLKKSLELQERASTYNDLGVVYENMGDYDLSIGNYRKALTLDPSFELARNNVERLRR